MIRMNKETAAVSGNSQPVILACLSSSPSNPRVIRAAAKLKEASSRTPIALYVGAPGYDISGDAQLLDNIALARELGFEIHTLESNDISLTISEYAKRVGITDLFLGYSAPSHILQTRKSIPEQLMQSLPDVDIHVIPAAIASSFPQMQKQESSVFWNLRDLLTVLAVMAAATLISFWFYHSRYSNANIITVYLLAVLIASVLTSRRIYGLLSAVLYILLFNYLFIDPRFSLFVYDPAYLVTYFVTIIAALITGSLAARLKSIARISAENAYQAKVLLDTSNHLEQAEDRTEIIRITCRQLVSLLNRTVYFYHASSPEADPVIYAVPETAETPETYPDEKDAVLWTMENNHHSGAFTSHFSSYKCRYFSIYSGEWQYGILAIDMNGKPFTDFEHTILLSIIHEFTMALDTERFATEHKNAAVAAENERLRAGLLRSISHDLRTPLTAIYGNANQLVLNEKALSEEDKKAICEDIMDNSQWLVSQMENILSMTKLENQHYLNKSVENIEDVIEDSIRHMNSHPDHTVRTVFDSEAYYADIDAKLIVQVLVNLLNNAVKYTPAGSEIVVSDTLKDGRIYVSVADNGPGISDEDKPHIFELFYSGNKTLSDSYRSMGIGLNLCEMIMKAHDGTIEVFDNIPNGTVFRISLKAEEAEQNDE